MKKIISLALCALFIVSLLPLCISAEDEALTVVAFGDSITAADKWQKYVEQEYGIDIINAGVGGDSTHTAMSRFKQAVINRSPDIVFISLGTNDAAIDMAKYTPLEDYKENMRYYIDECKKIGAKVIVNVPTPVVDSIYLTRHEAAPFEPYGGPNGLLSLYAQAAIEVAIEKNVVYVDLNARFLKTEDYTRFFPDGVHPSDTGYKIYGETVNAVFERIWIGDLNDDGAVDQYDYILSRRHYFGTITLDEKMLVRADVNCDEKVDMYDYILICRHYFGTYTLLGY